MRNPLNGGYAADIMIGERLSILRKSMKLSQNNLAEKLCISKFTVSSYETGNSQPSIETIAMLCRIFNVSADYLLGLIDNPLPYERQECNIALPEDLPRDAVKEINSFIAYQMHRHNVLRKSTIRKMK